MTVGGWLGSHTSPFDDIRASRLTGPPDHPKLRVFRADCPDGGEAHASPTRCARPSTMPIGRASSATTRARKPRYRRTPFAGGNRGRYRNPEYDALVDSYWVTIPFAERMQVLGRIFHHQNDQVIIMRLFFDPEATLVGNRLKGVPPGLPWNVHEWDVG